MQDLLNRSRLVQLVEKIFENFTIDSPKNK